VGELVGGSGRLAASPGAWLARGGGARSLVDVALCGRLRDRRSRHQVHLRGLLTVRFLAVSLVTSLRPTAVGARGLGWYARRHHLPEQRMSRALDAGDGCLV